MGKSGTVTHDTRPSAARRFVMLGVIHREREGALLLSRWLERLEPDVVTLELSQYGVAFRRVNRHLMRIRIDEVADDLKREGIAVNYDALRDFYSFADFPFEHEVAEAYTRKRGIPLYPVDMDLYSFLHLKRVNELLDKKNIRRVLSMPEAQEECVEKGLARLFFKKGVKAFSYTEEMYARDRYMRDRIALLMKHHAKGVFLHICGWQHLSDPQDVYTGLEPLKVFIHD
jgi:hypothetical protein